MGLEEFKKGIYDIVRKLPDYTYGGEKDSFEIQDTWFIIQKHISSGAEGGSCWGDEAKYFYNTNAPQDFLPLEEILLTFCPDISYLKYREIEKLIIPGEERRPEFYGNHTNYITFTLDIRVLYDMIFGNTLEG